jgi:DnaJ-domain-containing protein 1
MRHVCRRGELARVLYRLGHESACGVLTIRGARGEVFVLRRGAIVVPPGDDAAHVVVGRLKRLVAHDRSELLFEGGVTAYPPGAQHQLSLARWVRGHLEAQVDGALADELVQELAGARLSIRPELVPDAADETDRRMLAAMAQPRRLDQIWPLARTPRFRLLSFVHFVRSVGALVVEGVAARRQEPAAAHELLGVDASADVETIKRAYRQLARRLHPDLHGHVDDERRRVLERRLAEITAAYEVLTG